MNPIRLLPLFLLALAPAAPAEVKLHALFTDGAVLQRDLPLPIWGTAAKGEKVTVSLAGQTASTVAKDGRWEVKLDPLKSGGGPLVLTVEGTNKLEVKDVLVGEVWLCSGQSNMAFQLRNAQTGPEAAAAAENPNIRLFTVPRNPKDEPQSDVKSKWVPCSPNTALSFSAVGYFFGRDLQKALGVPVGLINSSVGGTPAQAWTSKATLESFPAGKFHLDAQAAAVADATRSEALFVKQQAAWKTKAAEAKAAGQVTPRAPREPGYRGQRRPGCLYNGMIAPLAPYAMRGAIWYQGEANSSQPDNYRELLPALIKNWRADFNPDLTFLLVQLAPFDRPAPEQWAFFREAQRQIALQTPNTGLAAIPDAGDAKDIHPRHKEPAGQRLALAAQALSYGQKITWSGPAFKTAAFAKGKATLTFDQVGSGLVTRGGELTGFTVAGADQKFRPAQAVLGKGGEIEVSSPEVGEPKAVRYAWKNMPDGNLWNQEGLPAVPFRTDDWAQPAPSAPARPAARAGARKAAAASPAAAPVKAAAQ